MIRCSSRSVDTLRLSEHRATRWVPRSARVGSRNRCLIFRATKTAFGCRAARHRSARETTDDAERLAGLAGRRGELEARMAADESEISPARIHTLPHDELPGHLLGPRRTGRATSVSARREPNGTASEAKICNDEERRSEWVARLIPPVVGGCCRYFAGSRFVRS